MQPESAAVLTITKKRFRNLTQLRGIVAHCASRDWSAGKAFAWLVARMPQLKSPGHLAEHLGHQNGQAE